MSEPQSVPPPRQMLQLASGYFVSQSLHAAARLGIADLLADGPLATAELAARTGTHEPSLYRLLRALAAVGVFQETDARTFTLTPLAELLRSGVPGSMRGAVQMLGDPEHYRAWGELEHSVRTGGPAFDHAFGMGVFEYFQAHPEAAATFDQAMTDLTDAEGIAAAYPFPQSGTVVDVAGGHGSLLAAILRANPGLQGVLFDLPHVIERAREQGLLAEDLAGRHRFEAGSFFEGVPTGADFYVMKHIIHDWDDEHCLRILAHCRAALRPEGRLLVIDTVIPPGNDPHPGKFMDLNMLVMTHGGRERTEEEFRSLFERVGFRLAQIVPTRSGVCYVEGTPA